MDFIARAGSIVDKGHRIIGVLLVIVVVQFFWAQSIISEKAFLQNQLNLKNKSQSIYVVPNSQAGVYKPAEGKLLLSSFVDYISQNLMTYTHVNQLKQYKSIRKFFSSDLLEKADAFFMNEINKAKTERLSSLFIADRTMSEMNKFVELKDKKTIYGEKTYGITLKGNRNVIVGGRVIDEDATTVYLELQETMVSQTNPFGFVITKFDLNKIKER